MKIRLKYDLKTTKENPTVAYWKRHPEHFRLFSAMKTNHSVKFSREFARRKSPLVPMGKPVFNQTRKLKKERERNAYLASVGRTSEMRGSLNSLIV